VAFPLGLVFYYYAFYKPQKHSQTMYGISIIKKAKASFWKYPIQIAAAMSHELV
jgi:hypothetical protein